MKKYELKSLIAQGRMKTLIKKLEAISPSLNDDLQDEILLVVGRYRRLIKQVHTGIVSRDDENVESNQMNGAFLALVEKLPEEVEEKTKRIPAGILKWVIGVIGLLSLVLIAGYFAGPKSSGDNSPAIDGRDVQVNYGIDPFENDSTKSKDTLN